MTAFLFCPFFLLHIGAWYEAFLYCMYREIIVVHPLNIAYPLRAASSLQLYA